MLETIIAVLGGACGIISIIFNIITIKREDKSYLAEFIAFANDKEFIDAKMKVYELNEITCDKYFEYCDKIKNEISYLCNFFNNAGFLVDNKRLTYTIFTKGGWGYVAVKVYKLLEKHIKQERKIHNKYHSEHFEGLCNTILNSRHYKERYASDDCE